MSTMPAQESFDENVVLDGLELTVEEGSVFALLGPNGSGKTTTVNILATLLAADAGRCASPDTTSRASPTRCATRSA